MPPALQGRDIPPGNYTAPAPTAGAQHAPGDVRVTCGECPWSTTRPTTRHGTGEKHARVALTAHRIRHHGDTIPVPLLDWIVLDPTRQDRR